MQEKEKRNLNTRENAPAHAAAAPTPIVYLFLSIPRAQHLAVHGSLELTRLIPASLWGQDYLVGSKGLPLLPGPPSLLKTTIFWGAFCSITQ